MMRRPTAALIALILIVLMGGVGVVIAGPPTMTKPVQIWDADGDTAGVSDNGAQLGTIVDADGDVLRITPQGAIDVAIQDQTSDRVNIFMHEHVGSFIILTNAVSLSDKTLDVQAGHGAQVGHLICLKEGPEFYQGEVLSTTATTITLDMPIDYTFSAGAVCTATSTEMAVNGATTTRIFHVKPNAGTKWDINKLSIFINGTGSMDSGSFGDQPALANGIVIRKKDGDFQNIMNAKKNGDFSLETPLVVYDPKPPGGTTAVRITMEFDDVVIRLDGDKDEELQMLVQDNAIGVANMISKALGHVVVD